MEKDINYYSKNEQQEAKKYFGEMIGAYMLQEQDEDNPKLVIRKDDIEKLKALLFMTENLTNRNKELEEKSTAILMYIDNECIRKSKVKEKIEELKKKIKYEDNEKVIIWLHKQIRILQELLEE